MHKDSTNRVATFLGSVSGASIVCVALMLVCVLPQTYQFINHLDLRLAYVLNGSIGHSPVFDRLLTFVADEDGRERLFAVVLLVCAIYVWHATTRKERAARFAMLCFVALIVGGALLAEHLMDEAYGRKSPSYVIRPFKKIHKIYGWDIEVKDRRSFPSSEAMVLLLTAFIMVRMHARWAWSLVLAGLVLPLGGCMVGRVWVSDIYLGALPISYLLSAVALHTRVRFLQQYIYRHTLALLDRSFIYWRRYRYVFTRGRLRDSQNVFEVEAALKSYIVRELPAVLGQPDDKPTISQAPLAGRRSITRIVELGQQKVFVRAYPRGTHHDAELHAFAATLLKSHDVNVPRLLHHSEKQYRHGLLMLVEEFIDGTSRSGNDLSPADIENIAKQVIRLHSIKSPQWGPLLALRSEDYADVLMRRVSRRLDRMYREDILRDAGDVRTLKEWFTRRGEDLRQLQTFSLSHGQLHSRNSLFTPDGDFVLIDFSTLEYLAPHTDLVYIYHHLLDEQESIIHLFNDYYMASVPADERESFMRLMTLFQAMYHLERSNSRWKRQRRRGRVRGEYEEPASLSDLRDLIKSTR